MKPSTPKRIHFRLVALVVLVLLLAGSGIWLQRTGQLDTNHVVAKIAALGIWALPAFLAFCIAGELLHLPGMLFVVAAQLLFGHRLGFVVGDSGALLGVAVAFAVARLARGKNQANSDPGASAKLRWSWAKKLLAHLEEHPIRTVILVRLVFWLSPPINYALGWSEIRAKDYLVGSAVGLIAPIAIVSAFVGYAAAR